MAFKFSVFLILFLFSEATKAQTSVKVTYEVSSLESDLFFDFPNRYLIVVFNDSLVYSYMADKNYDPMKRRKEAFGAYFINHGAYGRRGSSAFYHTTVNKGRSATTDSSKVKLISHTYNPISWSLYPLGKKVYGFDTETAVHVRTDKEGNRDTTIIWFAPALAKWKDVFGAYSGIGGLPMEIQEQYTDRKMTLTKMEYGDFKITFPSSIEVLTHEEYHNRYHTPAKNKKGRQPAASGIDNILL